MKRIVTVLTFAMIAMVFAACKDNKSKSKADAEDDEDETELAEDMDDDEYMDEAADYFMLDNADIYACLSE